ncbi:MAG: EAL domain-containing protein [Planctomycetes bacterium]|nr:EAL domain-containing protein [Planctomycetota bacterium]
MGVASAVVAMAHSLNLRVVAEGVDCAEQIEPLRRMGCDMIQGFIFSAAVSADKFTRYLTTEGRRIPVSAVEASLPLFAQVRADVGDHQSIVADLSTFSGHVTAMAGFLAARRSPGLFLFDEIGSGTDPAEGAALALAVLENLAGPGVTVVATTHQNALKQWAFGDERAASAAMEFDDATLRPTYRVLPNVVGHSAALDIAARCGLPEGLIERARELLGEDAGRSEAYMNKLRERLVELDEERSAWSQKHREFDAERADDEKRARDQEERRKKETARALDQQLVSFRKQARKALTSIADVGARRTAEKTAHAAERRLKLDFAILLTVHTMTCLHRGRPWHQL